MSIREYREPTEKVSLPRGGEFFVRGLSFVDIAPLIRDHAPAFGLLFAKGKEMKDSFDETTSLDADGLLQIGLVALEQTPALVAAAIANAMVEDDIPIQDRVAIAMRFPAPVQITALENIFNLTLESEGGLGNMVETLTRIFSGMNGAMVSLKGKL